MKISRKGLLIYNVMEALRTQNGGITDYIQLLSKTGIERKKIFNSAIKELSKKALINLNKTPYRTNIKPIGEFRSASFFEIRETARTTPKFLNSKTEIYLKIDIRNYEIESPELDRRTHLLSELLKTSVRLNNIPLYEPHGIEISYRTVIINSQNNALNYTQLKSLLLPINRHDGIIDSIRIHLDYFEDGLVGDRYDRNKRKWFSFTSAGHYSTITHVKYILKRIKDGRWPENIFNHASDVFGRSEDR